MGIHERFEVGQGDDLLAVFSSRQEAFDYAVAAANKTKEPVGVYDRMARHGCAQRWEIHPGASKITALPGVLRSPANSEKEKTK